MIMHLRFPWLAALLVLSASASAMGQTSTSPVEADAIASSAVGHWLYGPDGTKIGSVRRLSDHGQTAVVMVGSYFQPGSHEATVPAAALSIVDGKVILQTAMAQKLRAATR